MALLMACSCATSRDDASWDQARNDCGSPDDLIRLVEVVPIDPNRVWDYVRIESSAFGDALLPLSGARLQGPCARHVTAYLAPIVHFEGGLALTLENGRKLGADVRNYPNPRTVGPDGPHPDIPGMTFVMAVPTFGSWMWQPPPRKMIGLWHDETSSVLIQYSQEGIADFTIGTRAISSAGTIQSVSYRHAVDTPSGELSLMLEKAGGSEIFALSWWERPAD